jgi:hypothetical protein
MGREIRYRLCNIYSQPSQGALLSPCLYGVRELTEPTTIWSASGHLHLELVRQSVHGTLVVVEISCDTKSLAHVTDMGQGRREASVEDEGRPAWSEQP